MNIVIVPFHDWRKIIKEGSRTRDAHFIEVLSQEKDIKKVIINRPITLLEILIKKKKKGIKGEIIHQKKGFTLYKIDENVFLIDYLSKDIFNQIIKKYNWYINTFSKPEYIAFIDSCFSKLNIKDYTLLSQNVFAYKLTSKLKPKIRVFDAWDNFTKFKVYQSILDQVKEGYNSYAKTSDFWITNAKENIRFFSDKFNPRNIHLISNGVDVRRFTFKEQVKTPKDMVNIKRPIVGFGGKITQLLDTDLINKVVSSSPNVSFVFVGQLLDKDVFSKIKTHSNFYYLGDKHYDSYPDYVKNFDICIVPYVTKEDEKSGADSIKVYEYLATGKKVVGTRGNGLQDLEKYLYLVDTPDAFSKELNAIENNKPLMDINSHTWQSKVDKLMSILNV
ncbi:glycosyltransferase [Formosa sp. L2A11]|uniref:glycosyltransferase n=1 Tax=Formosa sp. L2A11 TaxID=2686363 RepID=UPI00131C7513|nr:glycosyltransferase [Formosa sp. L2A11]